MTTPPPQFLGLALRSLCRRRLGQPLRRYERAFSTSERERPKAEIYASTSHDPYFNLAFEDWLFRDAPIDSTVLLFYRNSPSVIVGRNQNPWKEINFHALRASGIPFVRRRSGGGTVYHDLGNTNYSIALPRQSFDRTTNAELVARGVQSLGINASVNERNDIVVDGFKMRSAYKIVNKCAYHHGTMLISAQLGSLGAILGNKKTTLITKGVDSVRSPVRNLQDFNPSVSHHDFITAVSKSFTETYGGDPQINQVHESEYASNALIAKGREELQSWEWSHGQTPEFTHDLTKTFSWGDVTVSIHSKKGIILDCSIAYVPTPSHYHNPYLRPNDSSSPESSVKFEVLERALSGLRYGLLDEDFVSLREKLDGRELEGREVEVLEWLRDEM